MPLEYTRKETPRDLSLEAKMKLQRACIEYAVKDIEGEEDVHLAIFDWIEKNAAAFDAFCAAQEDIELLKEDFEHEQDPVMKEAIMDQWLREGHVLLKQKPPEGGLV